MFLDIKGRDSIACANCARYPGRHHLCEDASNTDPGFYSQRTLPATSKAKKIVVPYMTFPAVAKPDLTSMLRTRATIESNLLW